MGDGGDFRQRFSACRRGPAFLTSRCADPGAIAQLGERYNGIVEVTGSIPVGSTKKNKGLADEWLSPFPCPEAPWKHGEGMQLDLADEETLALETQ
jgi:hypothetical protein